MKLGDCGWRMRSVSRTRLLFAALFAAVALLFPAVAQAKRAALVVGIDDYASLSAQAQPQPMVDDTREMIETASEALTPTPSHREDVLVDYCKSGCASARSRLAALTDIPKHHPIRIAATFPNGPNVKNALVSLRGLPITAVVTRGIDAGGGEWLVRAGSSNGLLATLPDGLPRNFSPEIMLLREDVGMEFSDPVTLVIKISPVF